MERENPNQKSKIAGLRNLNLERTIYEQLLFIEHADKENRHLSEEVLYNEQVESLRPTQRWGKQHQRSYMQNSLDLYPA